MNKDKGVNATRRTIRRDCRRAIGAQRHLVADCEVRWCKRSHDAGCQVDARDGVICTCRPKAKRHERRYFSIEPEQVYAYLGVTSYTNIGVGDVKTVHRRKVRKIYLPAMDERGVGSSEVSSVMIRKHSKTGDNYYVPKTTSSKCVGGFWQPVVNALNEKVSAVVKCIYATTGLEAAPPNQQKINIEIGNNTENKKFATTTTQVECEVKVKPERSDRSLSTKEQREILNDKSEISPNTKASLERKEEDKFSSESLLQRVHDLEHPRSVSQAKHTKPSLEPMEKKVEKEYRQMFASTKSKNPSIVKSKSLLRRRFEALRRGHKKEDAKKKDVDTVSSSPATIDHKAIKDVLLFFDTPFLEAESNYDAKPHAPANPPKYDRASFRESVTGGKKCLDSTTDELNEFEQGVSGVDKNVEADTRTATKIPSDATKDKICQKTLLDNKDADKKTGGIKFSFFKKRSNDKAKSEKTDKTKKGVPVNCYEVKHGIVHKTLTNSDAYSPLTPNRNANETDKHEDMQRKAWLRKFLTNSINSRDSVKIRWNNKTYATSSSTVFRIVDNVYKETGIVIRSKSDIQMNNNSYKSTGKKGNFVNRHIEAWMVPKTITDMPAFLTMNVISTVQKEDATKKEKGISKQKRSTDKAKTLSLNMKVVLRPNHKVQENDEKTSNFLRIDIPNDYCSGSCDEENRGTSDEKVYNIVEYEALKSNFDLKNKSNFDTGDHADNDNTVIVDKIDIQEIESRALEAVIKSPSIHKDAVVQDSHVDFPKRCDVIEVGVLTHKDVVDFKPILKLEDDFSEYESGSNHFNPPGCEFAQSYLQEYYTQWMPLDVQSPRRGSQTQVCRRSEMNSNTTLIQRHASKSCPNVCEDYNSLTLISSSHSSCSHCHNLFGDEYRNKILYGYVTSLAKSGKCKNATTTVDKETEVKKDRDSKKKKEKKENKDIRVLPKDSLEVFKRRKLYAMSDKSKWLCSPMSGDTDQGNPHERCVSMIGDELNPCPGNKSLEGIINYNKKAACKTDQKKVLKLGSRCEIPENKPACEIKCEQMKKPPCEKNTKPCPPTLQFTPPCQKTPPEPECKKSCEKIEHPPCEQNTEPCPPKPPCLACHRPPPDPDCKKHCEKMKQPPCDKNTKPCPPKPPSPQCETPPSDPASKKKSKKMKNPPCDKNTEPCPLPTLHCEIPTPEPPCKKNCVNMTDPPSPMSPSESKSSFNSPEPKINFKFTIAGSLGNKDAVTCQHPQWNNSSESGPPSPPSAPLPPCNMCMTPPQVKEDENDKNSEKIQSRNKSKKALSEPPCSATSKRVAYQNSEASISCTISFEETPAYDTCVKSLMKSVKNLKMASPPSESPSQSESDSDSSQSSEPCSFDVSTSYDTCKKHPKKCRKHLDCSCHPSGSKSPSECNAPASQFPERSTKCMISYEEPTHSLSVLHTSKKPPKCPKPLTLGLKYDVIVAPPDSAYEKKYGKTKKPPKDKKLRLPPSESPCHSERNASPSQLSEGSANCMMSFEESSDTSNNLEVSTEYDTSKNPQHIGYKNCKVRSKHDIIAEPPDRACQKKYEKTKKPASYKIPYPPSPPSESPCHSECNAWIAQYSDRSINCSMSFVESTCYDDTSRNTPEKNPKPYTQAPNHDITAESLVSAYQKFFDKIGKLRSKTPKPSPPSPSPPFKAPQCFDRSVTCTLSFEESSEDDTSINLEELAGCDTSENPPETVTKPYKVGPKYDEVVNSEYQKKYKKPPKEKRSRLPPPSPPSESPCHSECDELASQLSEHSINCRMSFEESAGCDTSENPPEQGIKRHKLSPKYETADMPSNSEYVRKNEKTKKPQEDDRKSKTLPDESPRSSTSSADSQFSVCNNNCLIGYEGCHKPLKMGPQYDVVIIPPDSANHKKSHKMKKAPSDESSMPSPASPKKGSKFHSKSSRASLISDCMITYQDIPGFSTCNILPQKKCNTSKPTCDKSRLPCPLSPLASPCQSRSNSVCSVLSACISPPPCPLSKCSGQSYCNYCKESCPEVRLTCPPTNDSFCVKKYPCKMPPLLGCKVRLPPTCMKYPPPSCSSPPTCNKYPSCSPPPKCTKYLLPRCSSPPTCNKYPRCSSPPTCKKYPSCSSPPKCTKHPPPSCSPSPMCKKYPSCSPSPMCKKYPSCSPPPKCNKYSSCSPPPMCNKYPNCSPPPMCNKYPNCSPPPMCNKYPNCSPPPMCNKYSSCSPAPICNRRACFPPPKCKKLPDCYKPPKCDKYIKTDCKGFRKISCKPTAEKGCDPFRKCGSRIPPESPCSRPIFKRCVLPAGPCKFPSHLCRPSSAPICPTVARPTPCLHDSGPCRLCAESFPCPATPTPLCSSQPSDCFTYPKGGLFLRKLPRLRKTCVSEFTCKKEFNVCSPTSFVEDCAGSNPNYSRSAPPTPCLSVSPIKSAVDMIEACADEIKKETTTKKKCTDKKPPAETMTFMDESPPRVDEARSVHSKLLGDMYQPSFCHRVTNDAQIANNLPKVGSQSLDNIVDIQYKIKITQGDKITEMNLGKGGEEELQMLKSSCRDDYVVNNTATSLQEQVASSDMTNGVNIHIVINNFKRKDKNKNLTAEADQDERMSKIDDDFASKIRQKFHTVSTAYSDTTNVAALVNKFDTATEVKSCSSQKVGDAKNEGAEVKAEKEKETAKVIYNAYELDKKPSSNKTDLCNNANSNNLKTISNHEDKKSNLKMAVGKAGKVLRNNKVSKLTKLFKAIVKTSQSSENAEMTVTDSDLTKDRTLSSFNSNVFRNTDSMNNYYKLSNMTSENEDCCYKINTSLNRNTKYGIGTCLCTTFAAKLNVLGQGGCPCSNPAKTYADIDTNCDIRTDKEVSHVLSSSQSDYLDVATQRSRLFISKANSSTVFNNNITVEENNVLNNIESNPINPGTYISSHHTNVKSFRVNILPVVNQLGREKECNMRKFHRETISNISDDNKIIANMKPKRESKEIIAHMEPMRIRVETTEESAEEYFKEKSIKANAPADVLQSYETKKAVLEIYTERTVCDGRKHLVAKLPKFTIEKESEIIKYEKICKRSFVMSFES